MTDCSFFLKLCFLASYTYKGKFTLESSVVVNS